MDDMNWTIELRDFLHPETGYNSDKWLSLISRADSVEKTKLIVATILYVRDVKQLGDNYAAYDMIYWFSRRYVRETKDLIKHMLDCHVGCWKDVKHIAEYVRVRQGYNDWLIEYVVDLMVRQLRLDYQVVCNSFNIPLSNAAKWCPREKTKYNWIFNKIAKRMYIPVDDSHQAKFQSRKQLRKLLSTLNKQLHTIEVKMCSGNDDDIYPHDVSLYSFNKYHNYFKNKMYFEKCDIRQNANTYFPITTKNEMFDTLIRERYMF